jgi:hypothetical protein
MSKEFAEKIAITVYGTDSKGEMFVEDTTTGVVAREYIKLVLRKRMLPGSEIIIFNKTNGNQAEFLLEQQDAGGLFQARLKDLTVDIWEMDFGHPPEPVVDVRPRVHLVCKSCGTQESVPLEAEEHSRVMVGEVLWRNCAKCGEETDWQGEAYLAEQRRRDEIKREEAKRKASPTGGLAMPSALQAAPTAPEPTQPPPAPAPPPPPTPAPTPPPPEPEPVAETNWSERRTSRRIQMKTRARVRRPDGRMEIVAPQNVSRGGIAFESSMAYALDDRVRVAMHYREGEDVLEVNGVIVRVSPGGATVNAYGVRFE